MNLLSDKIAMLYGVLNNEEKINGYNQWGYGSHRYIVVNDYSYIDDDLTLCIQLKPNLVITPDEILIQDPETGDNLVVIPHRVMEESEFFQLSTIYDFSTCDYDDLKFLWRHGDALQSLAHKHYVKVKKYMDDLFTSMQQEVTREITSEIDNEIVSKLTSQSFLNSITSPKTIQGIAMSQFNKGKK